jgi:enterobacterial common antigen flippase
MIKKSIARILRPDRPVFAVFQTVATQFGVVFINLATGILTARLLGPNGRGIFAAVTIWPQLLSMLALAGLSNAIVYYLRKKPSQARWFAGSAIIIGAGSATFMMVVGILIVPFAMSNYGPATTHFTMWCLATVYINTLQVVAKQIFVGLGKYSVFNISNLLPQLLFLAGLILMISLSKIDSTTAVLSLLGGGFIAFLAIVPTLISSARPTFKRIDKHVKRILRYSYRAAATDVVGTLTGFIDRLTLVALVSPTQLGFYVVAYSFSRTVALVQPAINSVLLSSMADGDKVRAKTLHDHAFRLSLYGLLLAFIVLVSVDRYLLEHVYGAEFGPAVWLFRILTLEAIVTVLAQVAAQLFLALNRPGFVSFAQIASFTLLVTALAVLIPLFGSYGAAFALLAGGISRLALLLWGIGSKLDLTLPRIRPMISDALYIRSLMR